MASPANDQLIAAFDGDSDYGSDFTPEEEAIVVTLLSARVLEDDNPIVAEVEHTKSANVLKIPRVLIPAKNSPLCEAIKAADRAAEDLDKLVEVEQSSHVSRRANNTSISTGSNTVATAEDAIEDDTRSPLERFRTPPKKTLSVTDLVSPAWCELQYWYTLKHHGRKKRTVAMKEGSKVHKQLEDQVHTTIKIDIETKEDAWGLRIWNVIQGLRTLKETGLTRELEVWGVIDGLVVNGVIDELSYTCPDPQLEAKTTPKSTKPEVEPTQTTIKDFFASAGQSATLDLARTEVPYVQAEFKKIYLGDVKTRAARNVPNSVSFRPTKMQLMLYHTLLGALAKNSVDLNTILGRYSLDGDKTFSDAFIVQIGDLNNGDFIVPDSSLETTPTMSQDSITTLLEYNNLKLLWSYMITELQRTIPSEDSLGRVLKAEYRSRQDGEIVGTKNFLMDDQVLNEYLTREMEWWRGKREAQGVLIQEAFKCRTCDFAEMCEWRLKKIDEAKAKTRLKGKNLTAS